MNKRVFVISALITCAFQSKTESSLIVSGNDILDSLTLELQTGHSKGFISLKGSGIESTEIIERCNRISVELKQGILT